MKRIIFALVAVFFAGNVFAQDVVFVGGWKSPAWQVKEFGEAIGANITIPLPDNFIKLLMVDNSVDHVWEQIQARGLDKQQPVLVAHSFGGVVLRKLLARHPEFKPVKLIIVGSPVGGFPLAPSALFSAKHRSDISTYAMASTDDETVSVSSALALPVDEVTVAVVNGPRHTAYFADPKANEVIRSWIAGMPALVASR